MSNLQLRVYMAPSLQWSGVIVDGDEEICRFAGCTTPEEVIELAYETGYEFDIPETV